MPHPGRGDWPETTSAGRHANARGWGKPFPVLAFHGENLHHHRSGAPNHKRRMSAPNAGKLAHFDVTSLHEISSGNLSPPASSFPNLPNLTRNRGSDPRLL